MSALGQRATEEAPIFDEVLFLSGCLVQNPDILCLRIKTVYGQMY